MSDDISDRIFAIAAAGARPHQKRFALERLEKVIEELRDEIDGGDECRGRDGWISGLIRDLEYVAGRVRDIQ